MADNRLIVFNLGSQNVQGAVFSKNPGGGLVLQQYAQSPLLGDPASDESRPSQTRLAVGGLVSTLKAKGASVAYAMPSSAVFVRFVKLPPLDLDQLDQIVEFEAQQHVPWPINDVSWSYQMVSIEGDPQVEVGLAAVKKEELTGFHEAVEKSGVHADSAQVAPMALYNAFRFNYPDVTAPVLLIDLGARSTNLVYVESGRVFIRVSQIGSTDITKAIAKEFDITFQEAENRKTSVGFVALGGPYADHDDPVVATTSKVIRNVLTRLHADIMRTTTHYRSQQGGSAPTMILLAGGSASLPFIREFFAEKLNLPTDYFNGLRNVAVSAAASAQGVQSEAHLVGPLVGLACSLSGEVPFSLLLKTDATIAAARMQKRKPYLVAATATLAATLGALGFYYGKGAALAEERSLASEKKKTELQALQKDIDSLLATKNVLDEQKKPYVDAVQLRAFWVLLLDSLHKSFDTDMMWFTVLEPLSGGEPVTMGLEELAKASASSTDAGAVSARVANTEKKQVVVDAIRIRGLYRSGEGSKGPQMVFDYVEKLAALPVFDLKDKAISDFVKEASSGGTDSYAYPFMFELPLVENAKFSFTK